MENRVREVLSLVFEFLISVLVIIGGGYLIASGKAMEYKEAIVSAITFVLTYWFTNRQHERTLKRSAQIIQPPKQYVEPPSNKENVQFPSDQLVSKYSAKE